MTVISLEERLAKELAGRPLGCTEGRADDMAYVALSDLALHCHGRREDVAWGIASGAAEDMEDED